MKKLLSLALALAIAATSVVSAAAASDDKIKFVYGEDESDYVTEIAYNRESGSNGTFAIDKAGNTDVKAYMVNGILGGTANVKVDNAGNVTVSTSAPVGEYTITGASSAKEDEAEANTNEIIVNVVNTAKLTEIAKKADAVKSSTVYDEDEIDDFNDYLKELAQYETPYFSFVSNKFDTTKQVPVDATQDDIDALVEELTDRYEELVSASTVNSDLKGLFDAVESVNDLHDSRLNYSAEAWADFIDGIVDLVDANGDYLVFELPAEYEDSYEVEEVYAASFAMNPEMSESAIRDEDALEVLVDEIDDVVSALTKSANRVGYVGDVNALIKALNAVATKDQPAGFKADLQAIANASNGYLVYVGKYGNLIRLATKIPADVTTADVEGVLEGLMALNNEVIYTGEPTAQDLADFDAVIDAVNAISADKASYDRETYNTFSKAIKDIVNDGDNDELLTYSATSTTMLTKKAYAGYDVDRATLVNLTKALEAEVKEMNGVMDAYADYLEFVNGMDQADYTSKSWSRFSTDLTKALSTYASTLEGSLGSIAIRDDLNTSRGNLDRAMNAVIDAVDNLVSLDYNENGYDEYAVANACLKLNAALNNIALYDAESVADFEEALENDEKLYKVISFTGTDVDVAIKTKAFAQSGLNDYADRLVSMIDLLEAKDGSIAELVAEINAVIENSVAYTADSYNAFYAYVKAMGTNSSVLKVEDDGTLTVKNLKYVNTSIIDSTADSLKVAMEKLVSVSGWVKNADGKWNFVKDGAKMTGWVSVAGEWYYMDAEGDMVTGWAKVDGTWYYLTGDGSMAIGWVKDGGNWYLMDNNGAMCTGWAFSGGRWFYLNADGSMKANAWISYNNNWYYVNNDGACSAAKWQWIGGKCYYFFSDAKMAANTTVDGYKLGADGAWVK